MTDKVEINITLLVPTALRLEVSWDEDKDRAVVHRVSHGTLQYPLHAKHFNEELDMENFELLDETAAEALGIERD